MATATAEVCANCGGSIGRLETPHVYQDHVVCAACITKLRPPPQPLGYATPVPNIPPDQTTPTPVAPAQVVVHLPPQRKWNPGVAALLSFILPGAGQIYKGEILNGLAWMVLVAIGYFLLVVPGVIAHVVCIFIAAKGDPYK